MVNKNKLTRKRKRIAREIIAPTIRRPNATSTSSLIHVPFWAYSLRNKKKTCKNKRQH
jgi:hypothetical protein